jgi:hypothetical protein
VAVATACLVLVQDVLSPTTDQYIHLFTGLEWWDRGTYEFEPMHPPLSRIFIGALPYASGVRLPPETRAFECRSFAASLRRLRPTGKRVTCMSLQPTDNRAFSLDRPDFEPLYRLAGLGTLPLFWLAALAAWGWGLRTGGHPAGLVAVLLFTSLPPVLGHGGQATTDMALVGTLPLAVLALVRLRERPGAGRAVALGAATGLALLSKFSALLFLPACFAMALWATRRGQRLPPRLLALALAGALLTTWAGYRFTTASPAELWPRLADSSHPLARARIVPAPGLVAGIYDAVVKERVGHGYFILGRQLERRGVFYFFPATILFKTPLAFLALAVAGVVLALRRPGPLRLPLLAAGALVAAAATTDINVGIRHVLPVFVFLAAVAAGVVVLAWRAATLARLLTLGLLAAIVAASARAHPDYLPYFNLLARGRPEEVLVDSDLDWGQDVKRLAAEARRLGIRELTLCHLGEVSLRHYAPEIRESRACPDGPRPGWLAVSASEVKVFHRDPLAWLAAYRPLARVGRSLWLYYIPDGTLVR